MRYRILWSAAGMLAACWAVTVLGTAPVPVSDIAPVDELLLEIDGKIRLLDGLLGSAEAYEAAKDKDVWQGFGVLSVMGQALAEHPEHARAGFSGAALRDAALRYKKGVAYDDARAALDAVKSARDGNGEGEVSFEWNKLIRMHPMMEEINARNARLVPIFRRPRGRPEEPAHATTIAVLALAIYADTHEVKNEADIPVWQTLASDFRTAMLGVAQALRDQDGETARQHFDRANEACDACHEKFRDVE